jgi:hypothetical protein
MPEEGLSRVTLTLKLPIPAAPRSRETGGEVALESIPPAAAATVGPYTLYVIEVHRLNLPWGREYIVACRLRDGDYLSPVFHVYCKDAEEFKKKVSEEVKRYEAAKQAGVRP